MITSKAIQPSASRIADQRLIGAKAPHIRKTLQAEKEWIGALLKGHLKMHNWEEAILWAEQIENTEVLRRVPVRFFEKVYLTNPDVSAKITEIKAFLYEQNHYAFSGAVVPYLERLVRLLVAVYYENQLQMQRIPVNKESTRLDLYQHLYEARLFIDAHHCQKLNLKQVADIACLSECHFLRYFKATFDITPHQYLTQKRLETAKILLKDNGLSVAEVSQKIGLDNLSSFSRLFKKHFGVPPERFRRI